MFKLSTYLLSLSYWFFNYRSLDGAVSALFDKRRLGATDNKAVNWSIKFIACMTSPYSVLYQKLKLFIIFGFIFWSFYASVYDRWDVRPGCECSAVPLSNIDCILCLAGAGFRFTSFRHFVTGKICLNSRARAGLHPCNPQLTHTVTVAARH